MPHQAGSRARPTDGGQPPGIVYRFASNVQASSVCLYLVKAESVAEISHAVRDYSVLELGAHSSQEPSLSAAPFSHHGNGRDSDHLGCFLDAQPTKISRSEE